MPLQEGCDWLMPDPAISMQHIKPIKVGIGLETVVASNIGFERWFA
jgi:hypothetical protein